MNVMRCISYYFLLICVFSSALIAQTRDEGIKAYNSGNLDDAVRILKKVTKDDPKDTEAWYRLGLAYLRQESYQDSIKALEKCIKLAPDKSNFQSALAYSYLTVWDRRAEKVLGRP